MQRSLLIQVLLIAGAEWKYWLRSALALGSVLIFFMLIVTTSLLTTMRIDAEKHNREHQQIESEQTFLAQPDRHPHRMVHYGHYLFRTPAPLAIFDPGLDSITGQSIFLEGHRHNTVMFAESAASADFGGWSWLNSALVYQLFAPLIIILLGYNAVVRERETTMLAMLLATGIKPSTLIFGKALALLSFTILLLLPLLINCLLAVLSGESIVSLLALLAVYGIYLAIWVTLTLLISMLLKKRSAVLAAMTGFWLAFALVLPSMAVNIAADTKPLAGKIETDLKMLSDLRKAGDGHNANDPAFQQLRANILKKYSVDSIAQLPINYRGVVALKSEQKITKVLNDYAEARMQAELQQEQQLALYSWLTPALAITLASRSIAGTDLVHYHRFQREAEVVRFNFVQGLNQSHIEQLSYRDDINRNKDKESWQRARIAASNWQVLEAFQFKTASIAKRIANAGYAIKVLLLWLIIACAMLLLLSRKLKL